MLQVVRDWSEGMPDLPASLNFASVAASVAIGVVLAVGSKKLFADKRNLPPQAPGVTMMQTLKALGDPNRNMEFITNIFKTTGFKIFRLKMPAPFYLFWVSDPESIRLMLTGDRSKGFKELDKPVFLYKELNRMTNGKQSIVTKSTYDGATEPGGWSRIHKAMAPSFSTTNLNQTRPRMVSLVEELKAVIKQHANEEKPIDMVELMIEFAFEFLCSTLFHLDLGLVGGNKNAKDFDMDGKQFLRNMRLVLAETTKAIGNPLRKLMFWDEDVSKYNSRRQFLVDFAKEAFKRYRDSHTEEQLETDQSVIAHLFRAEYPTEDERIADAILFFVAGYDTTAHTTVWTIIELLKNPCTLGKLRAELDEANPQRLPFTEDMMRGQEYLTACVKEAGRMWPITAHGLARMAAEDMEVCGYDIPKNSVIFASFPVSQRERFPDGEKFVPERWLAASPQLEDLKQHVHQFSSGKRMCMAQNLAMMEARLVLASLLHTFDLELVSEPRPYYEVTLMPKNTMLMARPRDATPEVATN